MLWKLINAVAVDLTIIIFSYDVRQRQQDRNRRIWLAPARTRTMEVALSVKFGWVREEKTA